MLTYKIATLCPENSYDQLLIASLAESNLGGFQTQQILVESIFNCENLDEVKSLVDKSISFLSYVRTGVDEIVETTPALSAENLDSYAKNHLGISNDSIVDYFNFSDSALLSCTPKTIAEQISNGIKAIYKGNFIFSQLEVLLVNFYLRNYPHTTDRVGLLNFTSDHVSLTVVSSLHVISSASVKLSNEDPISTTLKLISEVSSNIESIDKVSFEYDLILLAGLCDKSYIEQLKLAGPATKIEFFNPLNGNIFNLEKLQFQERNIIQTEGYRFVAVLAAALMLFEYSGVDLSGNFKLAKNFTEDLIFYTPQSLTSKVSDAASRGALKVRAAVASQGRIIGIVLLISFIYFGYTYYSFTTEVSTLTSKIAREQKVFDSLKDVRTRLQEYELKLKVKNDRIKSIENIQLNQNLVPTILYRLEQAENPLSGVMTVESLKVEGNSVRLNASSIDKAQTVQFLKSLADNGTFTDVNPVYDSSDSIRCRYSLSTTYNGLVPTHQIKLPISIPQPIPVSSTSDGK